MKSISFFVPAHLRFRRLFVEASDTVVPFFLLTDSSPRALRSSCEASDFFFFLVPDPSEKSSSYDFLWRQLQVKSKK